MRRLMVTGGGTGGHIYPALALARGFLAGGEGRAVRFVGSRRGLEADLVPREGLPFLGLRVRGFRGKGVLDRILFLAELLPATLRAALALLRFRPDAVLATGSFASLPLLAAARLLRRPYFLQEQNSVPGRVIALFAPRARALFLAYPEAGERLSPRPPRHLTGNPLRPEFVAAVGRPEADSDRRAEATLRLLAFGGSRGAQRLNAALRGALPRLRARYALAAVVQTGPAELAQTRAALADSGKGPELRVEAYLDDMPAQMARADLVVSRAGAMTLAEIALLGLPALLVPYPYAVDDHQTANARALERAGAARVLPDAELDADRLEAELEDLLGDAEMRRKMAAASASLGRPGACADILREVEKCLAASRGR